MVGTQPAYFEVVSPEIIRVGVVPIAKLQLAKPEVTVEDADLKQFNYVLIGDAGTPEGLAAPFTKKKQRKLRIWSSSMRRLICLSFGSRMRTPIRCRAG
jgi:hypothetical protein